MDSLNFAKKSEFIWHFFEFILKFPILAGFSQENRLCSAMFTATYLSAPFRTTDPISVTVIQLLPVMTKMLKLPSNICVLLIEPRTAVACWDYELCSLFLGNKHPHPVDMIYFIMNCVHCSWETSPTPSGHDLFYYELCSLFLGNWYHTQLTRLILL